MPFNPSCSWSTSQALQWRLESSPWKIVLLNLVMSRRIVNKVCYKLDIVSHFLHNIYRVGSCNSHKNVTFWDEDSQKNWKTWKYYYCREFLFFWNELLLHLPKFCIHMSDSTFEMLMMWWCFRNDLPKIFGRFFNNHKLWWSQHGTDAWLRHKKVDWCLRYLCWNRIFTIFGRLHSMSKTCLQLYWKPIKTNPILIHGGLVAHKGKRFGYSGKHFQCYSWLLNAHIIAVDNNVFFKLFTIMIQL